MTHRNNITVTGWLAMGALLVGLAVGLRADTIKLKDGSVWEGDIVSQTESQVVISVELAGGKITTQRTANRVDVTDIILATPEQKAAKQAERDYRRALKNQLDPNSSYPKNYYTQIITGVFDTFITTYSNNTHVTEIGQLREQWVAEREKVLGGQAKFHGQWLPASEAAALLAAEQAQKQLAEARALIAQQKWEPAIQRLTPLTATNQESKVVSEALPLLTEVYQQWVPALIQRRQQLESLLPPSKQELDKAQQELSSATQAYQQTLNASSGFRVIDTDDRLNRSVPRQSGRSFSRSGSTPTGEAQRMGGMAEKNIAAQAVLNNAKKSLASAQRAVAQLQSELQTLQMKISSATSQMAAVGIQQGQLTAAGVQAVATQQVESAALQATAPDRIPIEDNPEMLTKMGRWFKKNWPLVAVGAVVALWLMNRFTRN